MPVALQARALGWLRILDWPGLPEPLRTFPPHPRHLRHAASLRPPARLPGPAGGRGATCGEYCGRLRAELAGTRGEGRRGTCLRGGGGLSDPSLSKTRGQGRALLSLEFYRIDSLWPSTFLAARVAVGERRAEGGDQPRSSLALGPLLFSLSHKFAKQCPPWSSPACRVQKQGKSTEQRGGEDPLFSMQLPIQAGV